MSKPKSAEEKRSEELRFFKSVKIELEAQVSTLEHQIAHVTELFKKNQKEKREAQVELKSMIRERDVYLGERNHAKQLLEEQVRISDGLRKKVNELTAKISGVERELRLEKNKADGIIHERLTSFCESEERTKKWCEAQVKEKQDKIDELDRILEGTRKHLRHVEQVSELMRNLIRLTL